MSAEPRDIRIKRLRMRAWHRGTKEMDLILGGWADAHLDGADDAALDLFERVLEEEDQDLYQWVSGQVQAPEYMAEFARVLADGAASRQSH
ncbi:succinate dehydrogenase assembly factor 2 [Nioella aestuarii]|uniref:succinate dehydrogenase assembly factor 2 n=1 Tax=Nioella aestuarii TaxID=1662864 RepID=UPI003D7FF0CF